MRKRAREEITTVPTLYQEAVAQEDPDVVPHLSSYASFSSALYRHRRHTIPALPQTRGDVELDGKWTETADGQPYLLFADGEYDEKMLVFSSMDQLTVLQSADNLYMDSTFSSCPSLWNQVYIIHARRGSKTYPLVFALLPDRQRTTYCRRFHRLTEEVQQKLNRILAPASVQIDFEQAAIRAIETEFPAAKVRGCYSHFSQAIWRKVQDLGLAVQYQGDPDVRLWVRRASSLALLPEGDVQDAWVDAMDTTPEVDNAQRFNDYIVTTWVDDDARFPIPQWNHHRNVGPRTKNNLEVFHYRMNKTLPHHHPNIYRCVELIKQIEKSESAKMRQIDFGAPFQVRKRVYREKRKQTCPIVGPT
ncbi:uncharacterized protein LOC124256665 [Haliotis rubra]|uniref:uncharacterized protein LOC124256665 n=1 Tax=Haliotis rubra TaxID=36100 RepID=UPI001EE54133|nr:uncharacterized protein LOC124256665 [Haliotis rubra]